MKFHSGEITMAEEMFQKVRAFVAEQVGVKESSLHEETRLGEDLGVDGDDAEELMKTFSERFQVDLTTFKFSQYFGPEAGFNPIYYLYYLLRGKKNRLVPVSLRDLVNSAVAKKWVSPGGVTKDLAEA